LTASSDLTTSASFRPILAIKRPTMAINAALKLAERPMISQADALSVILTRILVMIGETVPWNNVAPTLPTATLVSNVKSRTP
jgi:hypothetical protein